MANRLRNKYAWIIALLVFVPLFLSGATTLHAQEGGSEEGSDWSAPLKWTVPGLIYTGVETAAEAGKKIVTEEAGSTVAQAAGNFVGRGLISFAAFVTWLGGTVFDYAMKEYVLEFGQNVAALKSTLNTLWTLVRDVCNLAFVFGFIYIGISTIINPDSASMKRFLSRIIIGAILINFSLYFTQVVIDFTNFTATQIYTSMGVTEDKSIMVAFRTHMGLSTLWDDDPETTERLADSSASFAYYIFGATVLLVAGLTFGITGILLIVRFIELFLIMIFSPIIFAARIFPQTEDYSKKIIKKLLAVSFFAPAYMLLIYVALTIANALVAPPQDGASMKEVILKGAENPNALTVIVNYCIVIILLWSSLSLAKKLGSTGGDMAISLSEKARKSAQGYMGRGAGAVTFGAAAAGFRSTVGRRAYNSANANGPGSLKDRAATSWLARQQLKVASKLGDASFDARGVGGVGAKLGIGDGGKGGHKTRMEAVQKKEKEYAQSLGVVDDSDTNVQIRKREMEHAERELRKNKGRLQKIVNSTGPAKGQTLADWEDERNRALDDLEKLEKAVKDSKTNHEKERNRRAVGSSFAEETSDVKAKRAKVEVYKQHVKDTWKKYDAELNAAGKAEAAIRKETADIERAEREIAFARTNTERRKAELYRDAARTARDTAVKDRDTANQELLRARAAIETAKKEAKATEEALAQALKTGSSDRGYAGVLENRGHIASWITGRTAHQNREAGKAVRKAGEAGFPKDKENKH